MKQVTGGIRKLMAVDAENEDLINVGAYAAGSHPDIDAALKKQPAIRAFLQQGVDEPTNLVDTWKTASVIAGLPLPAEQVTALEAASAALESRRSALYGGGEVTASGHLRSAGMQAKTPQVVVPRHLEDEFQDPDNVVLRFEDEDELRDAEARELAAARAKAGKHRTVAASSST